MIATTNNTRSYYSLINTSTSVATQLLTWAFTFAARIVFIRVLGVEILGINALFESILVALSLLDLGFGTAVSFSLYRPLAENNTAKIQSLITYFKKIYRYIAIIIFIGGLLLIPFIPLMISVDMPYIQLVIYYLLLLTSTASSYLFSYKHTLIVSDQKMYVIKLYTTVFTLLRVALQVAALLIWQSYIAWLVVHLLFTVALNASMARHASKMYPYINGNSQPLDSESRKRVLDDVKSLFLFRFSGVAINTSDNILGSILAGTVVIGLYSNYFMITNAIMTFFNSLFSSLVATIGNLSTTENKERSLEVFNTLNLVTFWGIGSLVVGMSLTLNSAIELWVGKDMLLPPAMTLLIVVIFYFQATAAPLWAFRDGVGMFKQFRYIGVIMAAINIILSIALGIIWGFMGVLLATLISRLSTVYWYTPLHLFQKYFDKPYKDYMKMRVKYASTILLSFTVSYFLSSPIKDSSDLLEVLIKLTISGVVTSVLFLLFFGRTNEAISIYKLLSKANPKMKKFLNFKWYQA